MKIKINKVIKKGRALIFHCETRNFQSCHEIPFFFFFLVIYCWAFSLPLREVCFSCEVPLEETKVSFAIGYHFEMVSGSWRHVSTSPLSSRVPPGAGSMKQTFLTVSSTRQRFEVTKEYEKGPRKY